MPRDVADVRYAGVLDGQTLNLDIEVPYAGAQAPHRVEITFARRGERHTVPAELTAVDPGQLRISAAILLGGRGVPVAPGQRWRLGCLLHTEGDAGKPRSFALRGAPTPQWPVDGPTNVGPRCARTGVLYRPDTGPGGLTVLRVLPPPPLAEVVEVRVGWTSAELEIRTVGFVCDAPPTVRFSARTDLRTHAVTATVDSDRIRCALPIDLLASTVGQDETVWDVQLSTGRRRLKVGRTLHDLANPKAVLRPTAAVSAGAAGPVRVRPYFTPGGRLAVACLGLRSGQA